MEGMPRRVADYAAQFGDWNLVITIFSFLLGIAQLVFIYNMVVSWRWGPKATANPWRAKTIEWQVSSPPPIFNFDEIPRVVGGPYEFGVPGARHAIMGAARSAEVREPEPARSAAPPAASPRRCAARDRRRARRLPDRRPAQPGRLERGRHRARLPQRGRRRPAAARGACASGSRPAPTRSPSPRRRTSPTVGQIVDRDEVRDAALSRVEVTQQVLDAFGIESVGAVMDPDPALALDDAVRAFQPARGAALGALRDPLRARPQGPGRVGEGDASRCR